MNEKFRKVPTRGITTEELLALWREGRLYVGENKKIVSKEKVVKEVRMYVKRINVFVTPKFRSSVDNLWDKILANDEFVDFLIPGPKVKKCRDFNKYNVMRIIGVLREQGVYELYSDRKFDAVLEPGGKESPYRRYLGMGLEQRVLLARIREIIVLHNF